MRSTITSAAENPASISPRSMAPELTIFDIRYPNEVSLVELDAVIECKGKLKVIDNILYQYTGGSVSQYDISAMPPTLISTLTYQSLN